MHSMFFYKFILQSSLLTFEKSFKKSVSQSHAISSFGPGLRMAIALLPFAKSVQKNIIHHFEKILKKISTLDSNKGTGGESASGI
jgi:hypothetical protein